MREILFRGKREYNGEWVYGYYTEGNAHYRDSSVIENHDDDYPVISSSVGQYTGFRDTTPQQNKIFEGDIVKRTYNLYLPYEEEPCIHTIIGVVEFDKNSGWRIYAKDENGRLAYYPIDDRLEVIGNIHDNPELLSTAEG